MYDCPVKKNCFGFRRLFNEPVKEMKSMIQNINDTFCKISTQLDKYKEELRKEREDNVKLIRLTEETRRKSTDYVRSVEQLKLDRSNKFGYKISGNLEQFKNHINNNLTDKSASRSLQIRNLGLKQEKEGINFEVDIGTTSWTRENEDRLDRYKKSSLYTTAKSKIPLRTNIH